ncbi:MAG: hypothetical protein A2583_00775 [Bdellovibrionales bacterium RIFOXYD1_FULL_53_11]|nr:MAG: hypothetical protein A2583_00775 [Bdellovibrionales bacterium RIFOXYD1_FULL_53_11]
MGRYFFEFNPDRRKHLITGTSCRQHPGGLFAGGLDVCLPIPFENKSGYARLLDEIRPDVIVNAGSDGSVDSVQQNPESGRYINYEFPLFLSAESEKRGSLFVHFSSNAVYDGEHAPYSELSPQNPVNTYGELKKMTDLEIKKSTGKWIITRPIVAYGWNFLFGRKNPVTQFLPMMIAGKRIKLVTDQIENPVYAGDVAKILWKCISSGFTGELNIAGGDTGVTRYDWIKKAGMVFGVDTTTISAARMDDFKSMAPRPRDTRFDISKLRGVLGFNPLTVEQGAQAMLEDGLRPDIIGMKNGI